MSFFKRMESFLSPYKVGLKKKSIRNSLYNEQKITGQVNSYFYNLGKPIWSERNYNRFASEAYAKNVVAYRCINMIAQAASSIPIKVYENNKPVDAHPAERLLAEPNPYQNKNEFLENLYLYRQISGNAYILNASPVGNIPKEIYNLRPDRMSVMSGENFLPTGFYYKSGKKEFTYEVDQVTGLSKVLHLKNANPTSDFYGLSAIEAAAYSIDQHNNAAAWNQALLQNGARPSGAIIVKDCDGKPMSLTDEQFSRLKELVQEDFSGSVNAGKPLILEGGLEWKEISLSPKDMDFIEGKNSAARDIALAFGVPPQLLGIPGDNTYSNLVEARSSLWEQTILPLAENTMDHIGKWLARLSNRDFTIKIDKDNIPAIATKRDALWEKLEKVNFMTINEKRKYVGLPEIEKGDIFS